jgi:hypothetical protein
VPGERSEPDESGSGRSASSMPRRPSSRWSVMSSCDEWSFGGDIMGVASFIASRSADRKVPRVVS